MYSQNNDDWSDWTLLEESCTLNHLHVACDRKGTLFVAGIDEKETLFVRQLTLGATEFTGAVQWSGVEPAGKCKTVRAVKTIRDSDSPLVWFAQNAAGQLYRRFDGEDDGHWITLGNHAFTDSWDVINVDENTFLVYGLRVDGIPMVTRSTYKQPSGHEALLWTEKPVEKIEVELHQDGWSISGENVVHTMQATELSAHINIYGELCMSAIVASKYPGTWYYAEERIADRSKTWQQLPTFGCSSEMVLNQEGAIVQFIKDKQNGISYMATLNPAAGWNTTLQSLGGNFEQWKVFADSIGAIGIFAIDKWNQLQLCQQGGDQNGFTAWKPLFSDELKVKDFSVTVNAFAKLQLVAIDDKGNLLTTSRHIDNSQNTAGTDTSVTLNDTLQLITQAVDKVAFEAPKSHPAANTVEPYKKQIGEWLTSLGDKIGQAGYKKLLNTKSLEGLIDAHLSLNDFAPGYVFDYMPPEHYALLVNKTHMMLADTYENQETRDNYVAGFIMEISALMDSVEKLTKHIGIPLPIDADHFKNHTLQMLKEVPDTIIKKLASHLNNLNLGVVHETIQQVTAQQVSTAHETYNEKTIKNIALSSGILRMMSGTLKLVYKSLPLNVGLGLNLAITAAGQGRGKVEGDVSAGVAAGFGATVPVVGIGTYAGAGAGNGTLFKLDAIWLGLVPAVLAPIGVLCDIAVDVLEAETTIEQGRA